MRNRIIAIATANMDMVITFRPVSIFLHLSLPIVKSVNIPYSGFGE